MTKDTIIIKNTIVIRDTLIKTIEKVVETKSDNTEIYKEILASQTQVYNLIMVFFLGIIALFAGATWLYNKKLAKSEIIEHTDKVFAAEKEVIMKQIKEEFEIEINSMKGESARLFALANEGDAAPQIVNQFNWWCYCIKFYILSDNGIAARMACDSALEAGESASKQLEECKSQMLEFYPDDENLYYEIFELMPDILTTEKKKLIDYTKEFYS